jgi:alanine racemase
MSLYTKVAMVKIVPKGEKIGYGMTYQTSEDEYIATLPIGYADGLIRANQGRNVYINGKYYPIVGRVCMDQIMVKVDKDVKVHDEVEIFGEHISLASMAKELNTIPYEIPCLLSERVERLYKK